MLGYEAGVDAETSDPIYLNWNKIRDINSGQTILVVCMIPLLIPGTTGL